MKKSMIHKKSPRTGNSQIIWRVVREDEDGFYVLVSGGKLYVKPTETSAWKSTGKWKPKN